MGIQKTLASIVGVVLTLIGIIGFFTEPELLGFGINALHNVVHLVAGIIGLIVVFTAGGANSAAFNKWFGVIYFVVGLLGFWTAFADLLAINMADNILHLVLGVVLAGVGFGVKE